MLLDPKKKKNSSPEWYEVNKLQLERNIYNAGVVQNKRQELWPKSMVILVTVGTVTTFHISLFFVPRPSAPQMQMVKRRRAMKMIRTDRYKRWAVIRFVRRSLGYILVSYEQGSKHWIDFRCCLGWPGTWEHWLINYYEYGMDTTISWCGESFIPGWLTMSLNLSPPLLPGIGLESILEIESRQRPS